MLGLLRAVVWRVLRHIIILVGNLTARPGGCFACGCEDTPGKISLPWGLSDWRVTSSGSL